MNEKAFEKVERDLNLATGEVKITEEMINLDRFRITSSSWMVSPICCPTSTTVRRPSN